MHTVCIHIFQVAFNSAYLLDDQTRYVASNGRVSPELQHTGVLGAMKQFTAREALARFPTVKLANWISSSSQTSKAVMKLNPDIRMMVNRVSAGIY